jgi:hypothetical protein
VRGETPKSFAVLINEDSFVEGDETFNISLSNPGGVGLGGPAIATVTITDDAAETAANPIDDPRDYVCEHYHDFLNRQPDQSGWDFWTNQITACGNDAACIEVRRINVSASFFLSIEFQDSGYLVERIYRAAFGDATGNSTFPSAHQLPVPGNRAQRKQDMTEIATIKTANSNFFMSDPLVECATSSQRVANLRNGGGGCRHVKTKNEA